MIQFQIMSQMSYGLKYRLIFLKRLFLAINFKLMHTFLQDEEFVNVT